MLPEIVDASARGAIVLLVALVVTTLMQRRSAAARHAVWVGAIAVQLVLLVLTLWGPRWRVAAPEPLAAFVPMSATGTSSDSVSKTSLTVSNSGAGALGASDSVSTAPSASGAPAATGVTSAAPAATPANVVTPAAASAISMRSVLVAIWAIGALLVLARLAIGTAIVARLARRGDRIDDGEWLSLAQRLATTLRIRRPLILLRGDRLGVPITWGIVYPIVLLPDDADAWPEERRRFVLVHEMAHVKRLDAFTQLIGQVVLAVFWFNPLVWIANRRMQLEREHACDDYVIRHGTQPSQYAADLLEMVQALGTPAHRGAQPAFAALAMARRSEFEGRMLSILDPALDRHPLSKGRTLMTAFAVLLLVVPLAALQPYRAAPAAAATSPATASVAAAAPSNVPVAEQATDVPGAHDNVQPHAPLSTKVGKIDSLDELLAADVATLNRAVAGDAALANALRTDTMRACDAAQYSSRSRTSAHMHSGDDASGRQINYLNVNADRCTQAMIAGKVTYTANEDDVAALGVGARVFLRERSSQDDRSLSITRGEGGALMRAYRRNGVDAPYDDDARRWLGGILPMLLAETSENVGPRVARWRSEGGVDGVLRHIAALRSSGAKRTHYEALIDEGRLSSEELDRVVRSASQSIRGSSSDLRAVLTRAAPKVRLTRQSMSAVETALTSMGSSSDQAAVLQLYGETDDRDMLLAVMRVAETLGSSSDLSRLLQVLAPRYLTKRDQTLEASYFHAIGEIGSSSDKRNTLMVAMQHGTSSAAVTRRIIAGARAVGSSSDRAAVLIALVSSGRVSSRELRDDFMTAAAEVGSAEDRSRVLQAAAGLKP